MASLHQRLMNEQLRRPRGQVSSVELLQFANEEVQWLLPDDWEENDWDYSWADEWEVAGRGANGARMFGLGEPDHLLMPHKGKWPPLLVSFALSNGLGWVGLFSSRALPHAIAQFFGPLSVVHGNPQVSPTTVNVARRVLVDRIAARAEQLDEQKTPHNALGCRGYWQEIPEQSQWPFRCLWMPMSVRADSPKTSSDWGTWEASVRQAAVELLGAPIYWSVLQPGLRTQTHSRLVAHEEVKVLLQGLWGARKAAQQERKAIREAMRGAAPSKSIHGAQKTTSVGPEGTSAGDSGRSQEEVPSLAPRPSRRRSNRL